MNYTYKNNLPSNTKVTPVFTSEAKRILTEHPDLYTLMWAWIASCIDSGVEYSYMKLPDQINVKAFFCKIQTQENSQNGNKIILNISNQRFEQLEGWNYSKTVGLQIEPQMDKKLRKLALACDDFRKWLHAQVANWHARKETDKGWFSVPIPDKYHSVGKWMGFMELEKGGVYLQLMKDKRLYK